METQLQKQKKSILLYNKSKLPVTKDIMHTSYGKNVQKSVKNHTAKNLTDIRNNFHYFWEKQMYEYNRY